MEEPWRVVADAALNGTRSVRIDRAACVHLHATPCDFAWLTLSEHSTLVKLLPAGDNVERKGAFEQREGDDTFGTVWLSEEILAFGRLLSVRVVPAVALQRWAELELSPAEPCNAAPKCESGRWMPPRDHRNRRGATLALSCARSHGPQRAR